MANTEKTIDLLKEQTQKAIDWYKRQQKTTKRILFFGFLICIIMLFTSVCGNNKSNEFGTAQEFIAKNEEEKEFYAWLVQNKIKLPKINQDLPKLLAPTIVKDFHDDKNAADIKYKNMDGFIIGGKIINVEINRLIPFDIQVGPISAVKIWLDGKYKYNSAELVDKLLGSNEPTAVFVYVEEENQIQKTKKLQKYQNVVFICHDVRVLSLPLLGDGFATYDCSLLATNK